MLQHRPWKSPLRSGSDDTHTLQSLLAVICPQPFSIALLVDVHAMLWILLGMREALTTGMRTLTYQWCQALPRVLDTQRGGKADGIAPLPHL